MTDSGIVPAVGKSSPRSIFYVHETNPKAYDDYVARQKHLGGKFYRIDLQIHLGIEKARVSEPPQPLPRIIMFPRISSRLKLEEWKLKYSEATHIQCVLIRGDGYEHRYSQRGTQVCSGIFGLLDIPNPTIPMAKKIRKAMNQHMATQGEVQPF